jgi:hypothetical protein
LQAERLEAQRLSSGGVRFAVCTRGRIFPLFFEFDDLRNLVSDAFAVSRPPDTATHFRVAELSIMVCATGMVAAEMFAWMELMGR